MHKSKVDRRRRHSTDLKARVVAACAEPGATVAQVARAQDLNPSLIYKWLRASPSNDHRTLKPMRTTVSQHDFVPIPMLPTNDIRVAIRRGNAAVEVQWPLSAAEGCAQWLTGLLR